jgi:ATP-dependent DNA helicase RecG
MHRLLQGEVGSGKTVIAVRAMLQVIDAGGQAALLAPTEVLAQQHYRSITDLLGPFGQAGRLDGADQATRVALLTGSQGAAARREALLDAASGAAGIVIGTHALLTEHVQFADLGMVVIDEQHRFGVEQRDALREKARDTRPHVLVMTATPIPRTLVLTYFGDMDVSELREKPAGRQPIDTRTIPLGRLEEVIGAVGRALAEGRRVYWVCPLVEVTENADFAAAEERFAALKARFGAMVDLVHGRMKGDDKDRAMARFAAGDTRLLVATTVIEVGVDVPEATVMVIEHAERFGLAQLHQLRGRIGRGGEHSTCLLLYKPPLGETAKARLHILRETEDGFRIAEEDLRLRGEGDVLGTRQSGLPGFRVARVETHGKLIGAARDDAALVLSRDPTLASSRGQALRQLLYLFERDEAIRLIRAG